MPRSLKKSHAALDHCLSKLKPRDRDLIVARYGSPATLGEYASQDGRSAGSLRVILNRLRSLLRLCIAERMIPEGGAK
jgi:DNA-directed RNA polymerase specialized sigma24 family protein